MDFKTHFKASFFETTKDHFEERALSLFHFQREHNETYRQFLAYLERDFSQVKKVSDIPFLPIELFKSHRILTGDEAVKQLFESSGTTGKNTSRHFVQDPTFYESVSIHFFEQLYGHLEDYHILALLPSYLERNNSSLIYMVNAFIQKSHSEHAGFYLNQLEELVRKIEFLKKNSSRKILLIGVSFALLDLAEQFQPDLSGLIVMETGGMKGRRQEIIREELHAILKKNFNLQQIHSEYGMTELLSQGYMREGDVFESPAWMKIYLRDLNDPFYMDNSMRNGALNVVDLANVDSCAFIATQDLGSIVGEHSFRILGRADHSDIRGCNLLVM